MTHTTLPFSLSPEAPPKNHKPLDLPPPKESVFKTSTGYRMDGSTVAPKIKTKESEAKKPEGTDKKQAQAAAASGSATKGRKNP
jgi:hypothetical protein